MTITWKKPASIGATLSKRCASVGPGGNQATKHAAQSIQYNDLVCNVQTDEDIADESFSSADATLSKSASSGLPTGIGHLIAVQVQAYSSECGAWSKTSDLQWSQ